MESASSRIINLYGGQGYVFPSLRNSNKCDPVVRLGDKYSRRRADMPWCLPGERLDLLPDYADTSLV
jgi:hypothetical protein